VVVAEADTALRAEADTAPRDTAREEDPNEQDEADEEAQRRQRPHGVLNPTTPEDIKQAREDRIILAWSQFLATDAWTLDLEPFFLHERSAYVRAAARMGLPDGDRAVLIGIARALDLLLGRKDRVVSRLQRVRRQPTGAGAPLRPPRNSDGVTAVA